MKTNGFAGIAVLVAVCAGMTTPLAAQSSSNSPASNDGFGVVRLSGDRESQAPAQSRNSGNSRDEGVVRLPGGRSGPAGETHAGYQRSGPPARIVADDDRFGTNRSVIVRRDDDDDDGLFDGGLFGDDDDDETGLFPAARPSRPGIFGGGSVLFLEADFDNNRAFTIQDLGGAVARTTNEEFDYDVETASRVWLGWQDDGGTAYRVRWFDFDDESRARGTAPRDFVFFNGVTTPTGIGGLEAGGAEDDTVAAVTHLDVYYIDAEITQELNFDNWQTTFGGGFRHAAISQQYTATGTAGGVSQRSIFNRRFDGEGGTIFGEVRIPIWGDGDRRFIGSSCLSLFGNARGSIVVGNTKTGALDEQPAPGISRANLEDRDTLGIGEIQLGAQLDVRPIDGSLIFLNVAYEAQYYNGAGSINSLTDDLSLTGFKTSAGLHY